MNENGKKKGYFIKRIIKDKTNPGPRRGDKQTNKQTKKDPEQQEK